jgi:hypothetical protein
MSRCTVCNHPRRPEIDAALAAGAPSTRLAALFNLSHDALQRHRASHLPDSLASTPGAEGPTPPPASLLDQVRALQAMTLISIRTAMANGDVRSVFSGVRAARANIELIARLLAQHGDAAAPDLARHPEWIALREALAEALAPFPEASSAVASRLTPCEHPSPGDQSEIAAPGDPTDPTPDRGGVSNL